MVLWSICRAVIRWSSWHGFFIAWAVVQKERGTEPVKIDYGRAIRCAILCAANMPGISKNHSSILNALSWYWLCSSTACATAEHGTWNCSAALDFAENCLLKTPQPKAADVRKDARVVSERGQPIHGSISKGTRIAHCERKVSWHSSRFSDHLGSWILAYSTNMYHVSPVFKGQKVRNLNWWALGLGRQEMKAACGLGYGPDASAFRQLTWRASYRHLSYIGIYIYIRLYKYTVPYIIS